MDRNFLPIHKINAVSTITKISDITDNEMDSLHKHIVKYLNNHEFSIAYEWAIDNGKLDIVKNLTENRNPIDWNYWQTHLECAIKSGHITIVDYLINYFFDKMLYPRQRRDLLDKLLDIAITYNQIEIVKYLVNKGERINGFYLNDNGKKKSPIIASVIENRIEIAAYLIKMNAPSNNNRFLYHSEIPSNDSVVQMILENCDMNINKDALLLHFARFGNLNKVKYLVENGATISGSKWCSFKECIQRNSLEVLEYLLQAHLEKNNSIPSNLITNEITDANKLLIRYANEDQLHLFHPKIINTLNYPKSARNVAN